MENKKYELKHHLQIFISLDYLYALYLSYHIFNPKKEERVVKIGAAEFIDHFVPMTEAYTPANVC